MQYKQQKYHEPMDETPETQMSSVYISDPIHFQGIAAKEKLSKEDAAFICVEALDAVPPKGLIFEVC